MAWPHQEHMWQVPLVVCGCDWGLGARGMMDCAAWCSLLGAVVCLHHGCTAHSVPVQSPALILSLASEMCIAPAWSEPCTQAA